MSCHAAVLAAQPHLSLSIFSRPSPSREERNGECEKPSLSGALASTLKRRSVGTSARQVRMRLTLVQWEPAVPFPVLCSGSRFGAIRRPAARRHSASLTAPLRGLGSSQNKFVNTRQRTPHKLLPGPPEKALLGTWEPGPLAGFAMCDPSRIREIDETEITTMYSNKVNLIGFLGNDAEVHTNDNGSFTTFSLATKSSYKKDGKYVSHTEWHRCVVFAKKLSEFAGTLKKGAHLMVEGELRSREYQPQGTGKKQPPKKTIVEIRVYEIGKLDRAVKAASENREQDDAPVQEAAE